MVSHLRNWIFKRAGGGVKWGSAGALHPIPPRLSKDEVFNVYNAHTKHCTHCLRASKNARKLRDIAFIISILSLNLINSTALKLISAASFLVLAFVMEKLRELFFKYDYSHQGED